MLCYFVCFGDIVFVDDFGYYLLFGKLKLSGVNIVGVLCEIDGFDVVKLVEYIVVYWLKLFFM